MNFHILCDRKAADHSRIIASANAERWRALFCMLSSPPCPILVSGRISSKKTARIPKWNSSQGGINLLHDTAIFPPEENHIILVYGRCLSLQNLRTCTFLSVERSNYFNYCAQHEKVWGKMTLLIIFWHLYQNGAKYIKTCMHLKYKIHTYNNYCETAKYDVCIINILLSINIVLCSVLYKPFEDLFFIVKQFGRRKFS